MLVSGSADSEVIEEQRKEKMAELKQKEKDLQNKLDQKLVELKKICIREAVSIPDFCLVPRLVRLCGSQTDGRLYFYLQELTGKLPTEYPLAAGEKTPHIRRRVGTTFKLDDLSCEEVGIDCVWLFMLFFISVLSCCSYTTVFVKACLYF